MSFGQKAVDMGKGLFGTYASKMSTNIDDVAKQIAVRSQHSVDNYVSAMGKGASEEVSKKIATKRANAAALNQVANSTKISGEDKINWIRQRNIERFAGGKEAGLIAKAGGTALTGGQIAAAYMMEDGKKAARWGTYAGVAMGARIISGGDPLHDNTGEFDIAGVPFI